MPIARLPRLALAVLTPCSLLGGCAMPQPPGDLVGSYHIEGALTVNECGEEALPANNPLRFDVQIRRDEKSGYWLQGMPPARPGELDDDGSFSFKLQQLYDVPPGDPAADDGTYLGDDPADFADPERFEKAEAASRAACRLTITETVEGSVLHEGGTGVHARGDDSPDLVGENAISVAVAAGSTSCARVTREHGGPFERMPCRAHYDLIGQLVDDDE